MKFSHTVKWFITGLIMVVVSIAVTSFLVLWLQTKGETLRESMQTIANEEALLQDQSRLTAILDETIADRAELRSYVLEGDDGAVALLSTIDAFAAQLGIELTTVSLEVKEQEGDFNDLELMFSIEGSERRIRQALQIFETLPYASDITSVQLTRSYDPNTGQDMMSGQVGLRVSIVSYD